MPVTEPSHLVIGRIIAPRGVRGELRVAIESDDPQRFYRLRRVFLGDERRLYAVRRARLHMGQALLELVGIEDRDSAETWRDALVYIAIEDALPLEHDEYYYHQIVGLPVQTAEGKVLGTVSEILSTAANDVYVVTGPAGELLLPAIKEVILRVDLETPVMVVRVPEGLR